jgi:hypothetical protein
VGGIEVPHRMMTEDEQLARWEAVTHADVRRVIKSMR